MPPSVAPSTTPSTRAEPIRPISTGVIVMSCLRRGMDSERDNRKAIEQGAAAGQQPIAVMQRRHGGFVEEPEDGCFRRDGILFSGGHQRTSGRGLHDCHVAETVE